MAETNVITAEPRSGTGKGPARAARRAGRTPAVVYGAHGPTVHLTVDSLSLQRRMQRPGFFATLFDLAIDGRTERVIARDTQLDPVRDTPLHVDFLRVGADTSVHIDVPVLFVNEDASPGLKRGGVLNIVRHEIELICRADSIPQNLTIDLSGYDIGDSVHIGMIELPEGAVPAITDRDFTIITIAAPTVVAEPEAEEAEEAEAALEAEAAEGEEAAGEKADESES